MSALIGDLVDSDAAQAGEPVGGRPPASADTRAMMCPTVRQEIRISCVIVVFEHAAASQATLSSKKRVWAAPWRAHGTAAVITPCTGHDTRGAPASR